MAGGISEAKVAAAIKRHDGNLSKAAAALKTSRQNISQRVKGSERLQAVVEGTQVFLLDTAEGNVAKALRAGDKEMTKFYLTQKGKNRGYGNNLQVAVDDQQIQAIVKAYGGDGAIERYRAALAQLGRPAAQIP